DYYRDWRSASGLDDLTPVVKYLIFANIAVFILQIMIVREVRLSPEDMLRRQRPDIDEMLRQQEEDDPETADEPARDLQERRRRAIEQALKQMPLPTERVSIIQEWFQLDT